MRHRPASHPCVLRRHLDIHIPKQNQSLILLQKKKKKRIAFRNSTHPLIATRQRLLRSPCSVLHTLGNIVVYMKADVEDL